MSRALIFLAAIAAIAAILGTQVFYSVDMTNQVLITRFGEPVRVVASPGLHVKTPFLEVTHYMEKRVLTSDGESAEYLTLDKKRIIIDHVTRWRIADPLRFFQTVTDETGAHARLADIVFSELRGELGERLFDIIIAEQRENIMDEVTVRARTHAEQFGIDLVDVRIKRADLPTEVQQSVFARMQAERRREANQNRAEGEEQALRIRADADRSRTVTLAEAQKRAQELRGEGDAEATAIYAAALGLDPEFYAFQRRLQAYSSILAKDTTVVLGSDSDLFRYLTQPTKP